MKIHKALLRERISILESVKISTQSAGLLFLEMTLRKKESKLRLEILRTYRYTCAEANPVLCGLVGLVEVARFRY